MKINKIFIISIIGFTIFAGNDPAKKGAATYAYAAERILYSISPLGKSEYNDLGLVDLNGRKVNLATLRTKVLLVDQIEKIYSDPETFLPLKIERTISKFWGKNYKTEEYDQKKFTVVMKEFKGKKLVKEQIIKADGQIQNVILFLFYLRNYADLKVGWNFTARVPDEFKPEPVSIILQLVSIDKISLPAGKFQAYHFKTLPDKFEFWINYDNPRVPLKIKIKGIIDFNVLMKKYFLNDQLSKPEAKL